MAKTVWKTLNKLFGQPNRMELVKGWARGWEEIQFNGYRGSVWDYGEVLETGGGDVCLTM